MWADPLGETCVASSFFTGIPHGLVGDGLFLSALAFATREQIGAGLFPAPVLSQGFQQRRAERNVTASAAFSAFHADHHALAIDVAELQKRHFGAPLPGAV